MMTFHFPLGTVLNWQSSARGSIFRRLRDPEDG